MEDRLVSLNKKIRFIFEEKSLPENIKSSKEYLEGYKKGLEEKLNKKSR